MTKHRWRESVKSFYGSHIDPDKDEEEELKGTKIEIEEKIQKILKLLKDEDEDGSVGNAKKETIADLIDFFQKKYQSLYSRYDHLTGELRKKVRGKQGKDSSSCSSSSDSDYSQRKKGSKNGKLENEFQKVADGIKQGLETANVEVDELKSKLTATIEEKEAIHSELQAALSKIQDAENTIRDLRIKSESLSDEKSQLFIENGKLTLRLDSAGILEAQLNQKLEDYSRENESLILEKETAKKSIEDEKKITEDLRAITDRLKDEKEVLQQEQEAVKKELSTTREQLESAEGDVAKLSETQKAFEEENNSLSSKILELSDEIKQMQDKIQEVMAECSQLREKMGEKERELSSHMEKHHLHEAHKSEGSTRLRGLELELEDQIRNKNHDIDQLREDGEHLQGKISELEKMLMERGDQFVALEKKLEDAENEASAQIATLAEQINTLQQELVSLKDEKSQLEVQIERHKQELESNIMDQERTSKEREDAFNKLSEEHKQHEVWFEECKENLQVAEKKVESMAEEFKKNIESKDQKVDELEETIEVLTRDVEIKGDEVSTLAENVSMIEVKLRLSNQKLRITEQLLTEKEDSQRNKEEKLQQQQKFLEERIATMSGIIATYKSVQLKMKTEISERVNSTLNGMDTLTMKFEEDYGHIESCVYGTFNELQVAKNWVKETKCEKEQLKKEVANLVEELKHEREQESILRDRIGEQETTITELGTKLQKDEEEKKILINAAKQFEVKMGELEKLINEKDEGILGLQEEKREAIKQLSMWADYHRSRCDLLKEMLSMTHGGRRARGRRQITT